MPERAEQGPERLLSGSDRPRPLPPALRARLEEALLTRAGSVTVRAPVHDQASGGEGTKLGRGLPSGLPPGARERLSRRLASRQQWRKWSALGALGAAAAAIVAVVSVAVPGTSGRPVAAPSHPKAAASAPVVAHPLPANGAASGASGGEAKGVAAAGRPAIFAPAPHGASTPSSSVIRSVVPADGPAKGGNWVVVKGNGLGNAGAVYFGRTPAPRIQHVSAGELRALAPAHAPGTVTVSVGSPALNGRLATSARSLQTATRANQGSGAGRYTFRS